MVLTYALQPYVMDADRWLDFLGRVMIIGTCAGVLIIYSLYGRITNSTLGVDDTESYSIYKPWKSYRFLAHVDFLSVISYLLIDIILVLYMYSYTFYVFHHIGVFRAVKRFSKTLLLKLNDSVLDYLVGYLERRTIGCENIFTGMMLLQQW